MHQAKHNNPAIQSKSVPGSDRVANKAAAKVVRAIAKQQLGKSYVPAGYFDLLSDAMRGYLAVLVNPFEMQKLGKSAGVPVAPSAPSRKYTCFARGTFSTVPRNTSDPLWIALGAAKQAEMLRLTEANVGYVMVNPKLFGVNTEQTTYVRNQGISAFFTATQANALNTYSGDINRDQSRIKKYTIMQQPVVYTVANNGLGAPSRLYEANPELVGERVPTIGYLSSASPPVGSNDSPNYYSPGVDLFDTPAASEVLGNQPSIAMTCCTPFLNSNLARMSSNSDVNWWEVMPPDAWSGDSSSLITAQQPAYGAPRTSDGTRAYTSLSGSSLLNTRKIRLVSCGIRIKYIGAEINRGGQVIGLREPSGLNMAAGAFGGIFCASETSGGTMNFGSGSTASTLTSSYWDAPADTALGFTFAPRSNYEVVPQFRSADWRAFCGDSGFGCQYNNNIGNSSSIANWINLDNLVAGQPFDTVQNPDDTYGFDQLSEYDQGVPGDVERPWDELVYYPVDPSNAKYEYLYETVSTQMNNRMGVTPACYYVADLASSTESTTPTRIGHFKLNGALMSATEACEHLSKNLSRAYLEGQLASKKITQQQYADRVKALSDPAELKRRLGTAAIVPSTTNSNASGDVNVHLGIQRADNDWGYSLAWIVRGPDNTTVTKFQFEVVGHYEVIGRDVRGQTAAAPPDPVGVAAMSAVAHDLAYTTTSENRVKHSVPVAASKIVQAIEAQSGTVEKPTKNIHKMVMDGLEKANSFGETIQGAVGTLKGMKDAFGEVKDFIAPIMDSMAMLFMA